MLCYHVKFLEANRKRHNLGRSSGPNSGPNGDPSGGAAGMGNDDEERGDEKALKLFA